MVISSFFPHKSVAEVQLKKGIAFSLSTVIDGVLSFSCFALVLRRMSGQMAGWRDEQDKAMLMEAICAAGFALLGWLPCSRESREVGTDINIHSHTAGAAAGGAAGFWSFYLCKDMSNIFRSSNRRDALVTLDLSVMM